jgi:leucine dehydrogenase
MRLAEARSLESDLTKWDGECVVTRFDPEAGAWIVIAVHSSRLGPATGGTRMKEYGDLTAATRDALRLAESMTYKMALTGLPCGGGKAVIAVPSDLDTGMRSDLLRRYGRLLSSLGGMFRTGPDVGTSSADMDVIAETGAPYVFSRTPSAGGPGSSAPATAHGTFQAIRTVCSVLYGDPSPSGKRIVVQGAGNVGSLLAEMLVGAAARVLVADVDSGAARRVSEATGAEIVTPDRALATPCDIFSPCALGGVLNPVTIASLRCRAIVGAANNQVASSDDAAALKQRGILFAPDIVVGMGGAMAITGMETLGWTQEEAAQRVAAVIDKTLRDVFDESLRTGASTLRAARIVAGRRLWGDDRLPGTMQAGTP